MDKKEHQRKRYEAMLLDWMGSGFEVPRFDTVEEAVEEAKRILTEGRYARLYSSILISEIKQDSENVYETEEVLIVEKQPETWKIVEIKPEEFEEKSLYRYNWEMYKNDIEHHKDPEEYKKKEEERFKKMFAKPKAEAQ